MGELRATGPGEKEARRQQILASAGDLLSDWSFTDITMDRIADLVGLAKGTLYLYFRTKETLFLSLYEEHLSAWYSELETLAIRAGGIVEPSAAARVIASTLAARPILVQLHGLLHSTLGHNIDLDTAIGFRRHQHLRMTVLAAALAGRIEGLSEARAYHFLVQLEAVVGGLSWAATPPSPVAQAFEGSSPRCSGECAEMLDVRCSMLDARCSMLDARCSMLDARYSKSIDPVPFLSRVGGRIEYPVSSIGWAGGSRIQYRESSIGWAVSAIPPGESPCRSQPARSRVADGGL
jgi:AcrR family transcriptional regulator